MAEVGTETALSLAQKAGAHLATKGVEQARLEAELLLAAVLGISRLDLYLQFDRPIDDAQLEQFRNHVRRRLKREPLQYILGRTTFRKLELSGGPARADSRGRKRKCWSITCCTG